MNAVTQNDWSPAAWQLLALTEFPETKARESARRLLIDMFILKLQGLFPFAMQLSEHHPHFPRTVSTFSDSEGSASPIPLGQN